MRTALAQFALHLATVGTTCIGLVPCATVQAAETASVAWLRNGTNGDSTQVEIRELKAGVGTQPASIDTINADSQQQAPKVPLGSLWKLFVFAYLSDTHASEAPYTCTANSPIQRGEDLYCCDPGESIARGPALARSCAPYFSPERLHITQNHWQAHWHNGDMPAWLRDLKQLQPATEVKVSELLQALTMIPPAARAEARAALLQTGTEGYGRDAWPELGSGIRYKTYSWHRADGSAFGGAAGWLADGTPFWFGARGSSKTALSTWAQQLAQALPQPAWHNANAATGDESCVDVDFFARYPLRAVWLSNAQEHARAGELKGIYRLEFANGNWLRISSNDELLLSYDQDNTPIITGRFTINDYVARVVEREGSGEPVAAGRALAIAARSYLLQNGNYESGCWRIDDASRTQRVSPNTPGDAALAAAWFTDDIILRGVQIHYHSTNAAANRLSWSHALEEAKAGRDFEAILKDAYPHATVATVSGSSECAKLGAAETWLEHAIPTWQRRLQREPGFEALSNVPSVCALHDGNPYSDQNRLRIYVRGWRSLDERITLAHEYLHLAFRFHPNGIDENYVEQLARQLIGS